MSSDAKLNELLAKYDSGSVTAKDLADLACLVIDERDEQIRALEADAREIFTALRDHWAKGGDEEGTFENIMLQVNHWLDAHTEAK